MKTTATVSLFHFSNETDPTQSFVTFFWPPTPCIHQNPIRLPLNEHKFQWENDFHEEYLRDWDLMITRWEKEMAGDRLVALHRELELKRKLVEDYSEFPFDMAALFIRQEIRRCQKRYPKDLVEWFYGDWDKFNDLGDQIEEVEEVMSDQDSQEHLDDLMARKLVLEELYFRQSILIRKLTVPRINLEACHLPEDLGENFPVYQKPKTPPPKPPPRKRLFPCAEKLPSSLNWEIPIIPRPAENKDPHELFFQLTTSEMSLIDEDFLPELYAFEPRKKGRWDGDNELDEKPSEIYSKFSNYFS